MKNLLVIAGNKSLGINFIKKLQNLDKQHLFQTQENNNSVSDFQNLNSLELNLFDPNSIRNFLKEVEREEQKFDQVLNLHSSHADQWKFNFSINKWEQDSSPNPRTAQKTFQSLFNHPYFLQKLMIRNQFINPNAVILNINRSDQSLDSITNIEQKWKIGQFIGENSDFDERDLFELQQQIERYTHHDEITCNQDGFYGKQNEAARILSHQGMQYLARENRNYKINSVCPGVKQFKNEDKQLDQQSNNLLNTIDFLSQDSIKQMKNSGVMFKGRNIQQSIQDEGIAYQYRKQSTEKDKDFTYQVNGKNLQHIKGVDY